MSSERKKILVIEDEELIRASLIDLLEIANFEVLEAENGLVGLEKARSARPHLVISDVMMPHLDGYGVLAGLRQQSETAHIPFLFLTAKARADDAKKGLELGATAYLTKPFSVRQLLEVVYDLLQKAEIKVF